MTHQKSKGQNVVYLDQRPRNRQMAQKKIEPNVKNSTFSTQNIIVFAMGSLIIFIGASQLLNSYQESMALDEEYFALKQAEEEAMHENIRLQQEYQLMQDPNYLAEVARRDYLYSKPGEIVFDLDEE